jgi:sugar phosphate isomerase/epimerase
MRRIIIQKHRRPQLGEGLVPWDEYIATLRAIGYGGWYALEDETGKDVIDSLKRGGAFLERYWTRTSHKIGTVQKFTIRF